MKEILNQNSIQKTSLGRLLAVWKPGMVLSSSFLSQINIPPQTVYYLREQGILTPLGKGAYIKMADTPSWAGACTALQFQTELPLHVGGKSALQLLGVTQYQTLGQPTLWLMAEKKFSLPAWFKNYSWDFSWYFSQVNLFGSCSEALEYKEIDGFCIQISKRERAILEMIYLIGKYHTFEEVEELFEGLITLDPKLLQQLLSHCTSIKVCRIFFYFAHKYQPIWLQNLDQSGINFGAGKRVVVKGGRFDSQYGITVPRGEEVPDV